MTAALRHRYGRAHKPVTRLSIDGWRVRYYEPTYGTREFDVVTHKALADARKWLDAGGYSYSVKELR
jgi:hypothetical protein